MVDFFLLVFAVLLSVLVGHFLSKNADDKSIIIYVMLGMILGHLIISIFISIFLGLSSFWIYLSFGLVSTLATCFTMAFKMLGRK